MAVDIHAAPGRRILFTASTWSHLANFHRPYLRALADRGYLVDGACGGAPADLPELARAVHLSLEKKMPSPKNLAAAAQIRRLLASGEYDLVSCHTALAAFFRSTSPSTGIQQTIYPVFSPRSTRVLKTLPWSTPMRSAAWLPERSFSSTGYSFAS